MNKLIIGLMLLTVIFYISKTDAAVQRGIFKDPAHPGKCVVKSLILNPGQSGRHPDMCARVICEDKSQAQIHTCGVVGLPPGSKFGGYKNPNADYPACCERHIIQAK